MIILGLTAISKAVTTWRDDILSLLHLKGVSIYVDGIF
jgi:hypothetical protein